MSDVTRWWFFITEAVLAGHYIPAVPDSNRLGFTLGGGELFKF